MKKPIAVIITDTHLKEENVDVNKSIFSQAMVLAADNGLKSVYHGGDIFNSRKGQTIVNLRAFAEILENFAIAGMELVAIPGNHDKTNYSSEESFLDPFKHHPGFRLLSTPDLANGITSKDQVGIHMMPFFADEQYIEKYWFNEKHVCKKNVLITHIGVNGAVMNNGTKPETRINTELFKDFDKVLIGHYHDAQVLSNKIQYIGASLQHNFGEKPVKGATVLYDDLSIETVPFEFPQYLAFELDASKLTLADIKDFELTQKETGNHLRIVLTGTEADINSIDKHRLQIAGISVTTKKDAIVEQEVEESVIAFTDQAILESFKDFCKKNALKEKEGLKYLKEAVC